MPNSSLISVIIPVYNGEKYLAETIESVLNQSYQYLDVIVIDDGSTDSSAAVAKQYFHSIKYFYQPNKGLASALNQGISISWGEYISFLDADDLWLPDKLNLQMKSFEINPASDMVFGHMRQFFSPELDDAFKSNIALIEEIMPSYFKGSMLIKRESFFRAGLFDTRWQVGDYIDWYLKAIERGLKSFTIPDVVLERRIHKNNMGITQKKLRSDYLRILKTSLDRRRSKG